MTFRYFVAKLRRLSEKTGALHGISRISLWNNMRIASCRFMEQGILYNKRFYNLSLTSLASIDSFFCWQNLLALESCGFEGKKIVLECSKLVW